MITSYKGNIKDDIVGNDKDDIQVDLFFLDTMVSHGKGFLLVNIEEIPALGTPANIGEVRYYTQEIKGQLHEIKRT